MTTEAVEAAPKPVSKYVIEDTAAGFVIRREGGLAVEVTYAETYVQIGSYRAGLYDYRGLVDKIAEWFMDHLIRGYLNKRKEKEGMGMIARALSRRLKPHWQRLVSEIAPPDVSELARLMWSSVHGDAAILHQPELYSDDYRHLRHDLKRYHACRLIAKQEGERLIIPDYETGAVPPLIERVMDWRRLYAGNAVSPKALNKTLDKLPRAISFRDIDRLVNVHLEQPITERLHLLAVLSGAEHFHWYMHEQAVLKADAALIVAAGAVVGLTLKAQSKTSAVAGMMRFILDYPAPYRGDLVGLAQRSAEWHQAGARMGDESRGLPADTVLPLLQLDYAALEAVGVTPLRTVGDVVQEGVEMGHCVGSYAWRAHKGHSFLFHVSHEGTTATIELSARGLVQQAYGPRNTINAACAWGSAALAAAVRAATAQTALTVIPAIPF